MKKMGTFLWHMIENILRFAVYKVLRLKLDNNTWEKLLQFIKFVLVGFSNVMVSYVIYLIFFLLFQTLGILPKTDYLIAQFIGYVLSIFWSFYWNRKYVFETEDSVIPWYKELIKSFVAYSFTGVFLNSALSYFWVVVIGIPKIISPIINLIVNVPINFVLNKFWAFKIEK